MKNRLSGKMQILLAALATALPQNQQIRKLRKQHRKFNRSRSTMRKATLRPWNAREKARRVEQMRKGII